MKKKVEDLGGQSKKAAVGQEKMKKEHEGKVAELSKQTTMLATAEAKIGELTR